MTDKPDDVLRFWREAGRERWFTPDGSFDALCRERFGTLFQDAAAGRLQDWEATPDGALALVILLDQLPRNMFRGSARAWATDPAARDVADRALARGFDGQVDPSLRAFMYLPFEHEEGMAGQARSVALFEAAGDEDGLKWAHLHRDIIARFGRFPHRNAALGRISTPEEDAYLAADGFKG